MSDDSPKIKPLRERLLASPRRKWDLESSYQSIYIVPTKKKHDSGWTLMAIVGCLPGGKYEIAAQCDDIGWEIQLPPDRSMRTDCDYPSRLIHFWHATFTVGCSLSSTTITVTEEQRAKR